VASQAHDWAVYRLGGIFGSVGHRVKIHKITSATGKERGDLEIKDYVVLQKPLEQADRLPPPRTLILDFTLTHTRYDSSHVHTTGQLTNTRSSDGAPELDGVLRKVDRKKILHYRQLYINRPDPIAFLPYVVDTTGRVCDDLVVYYSCTLTVKLRLWPTKYRRNRVNFASFVRLAMLILKGQWG
jgi:hypothetical protein